MTCFAGLLKDLYDNRSMLFLPGIFHDSSSYPNSTASSICDGDRLCQAMYRWKGIGIPRALYGSMYHQSDGGVAAAVASSSSMSILSYSGDEKTSGGVDDDDDEDDDEDFDPDGDGVDDDDDAANTATLSVLEWELDDDDDDDDTITMFKASQP